METTTRRGRSPKAPLNLYVTDEARRQLLALAEAEGRSVSSMVERLVRQASGQIEAVLRRGAREAKP